MRRSGFSSKIVIVSGPSGVGKTTIIRRLLQRRAMRTLFLKTVSYTTRKKRYGEKEGRDYFFVTPGTFRRLIRARFFLEWKRVLRHCYGTPRYFIAEAQKQHKHLVLCIDVKGALQVKRKHPFTTVLIFILPPSLKELENRLLRRKSETAQTVRKRLRLAKKEIPIAKKYDYCIINSTLRACVDALEAIMNAQ